MVRQFVNFPHDYDLWPEYDALNVPGQIGLVEEFLAA